MEKDIGKQLVEFSVNTKYEKLPKDVIEFTKLLTLKTVSGMLAGSAKPSGRKMGEVVKEQKCLEEFRVIGSGLRTSLWNAILLNAYFAHAAELEDDKFDEGFSWDITVIPLLLNLAEKLRLSGKDLIEALVVGLEVHTRTCSVSSKHLGLALIPGAVGPAIGAAKALGLGVKETSEALGLAMSGVPIRIANTGTDAHFFESALQALQGVIAAEMAKAGLKGNPDIEGYLINHLGKENVVPGRIVEDLGNRWFLREIAIKKYGCCLMLHRHIDLVIELMKKHNLSYQEVEAIEAHSSPADKMQDRPEPKEANDLQFSIQHVLAAAMLYGDVSLEHISDNAVGDKTLEEARRKVKFIIHPELSNQFLQDPARVVIKTKDGKEFSGERMYAIGHPRDPMKKEQIIDLYWKFSRGVLNDRAISRSADLILNLENLDKIDELMNIVASG